MDALLKVDHINLISQKLVTIKVTEDMDVSVHIKHPHKIIKGTLTTLQEEMVVVEIKANMVLQCYY